MNTSRAAGPLAGIRVLELGGIGPGPFTGMMLADMGAEVIRVERAAGQPERHPALHRGRRSIAVNLKNPEGVEAVRRIADGCDALIEGFRPGVAERLGLGPQELLARNPRLVYGRMTGWGQEGPWAQAPGHDINYLSLTGGLHAIGPKDGDPVPPLNLVSDFGGGGMLLAYGIACALISARTTGEGQVVDAAMTDGTSLLLAMTFGLLGHGSWTEERASNMLDGGAPFYRTYRCADGGHVAVGCVEPQFYAEMLDVLGLTGEAAFAGQLDRALWPAQHARLEQIFATRTRDDWAKLFESTQACVTPVLTLSEAARHRHNVARHTFTVEDGQIQPMPAPRFSGTPTSLPKRPTVTGDGTRDVLADAGLTDAEIDVLGASGAVGWAG
ncbi:CaiB/BaiF CoA transferase family protein [Streptomyces abyssomicinicus]|uniref:CaiB/BaiF CoA transferase family protein n=1 Tax=Streptomyces abyssomicinicus TaxID=574929 RepID=UPI00124FCA9C|nr:CaiB/BaiF CoA-transferase family protein [Streptomyces abyssomicinicus]